MAEAPPLNRIYVFGYSANDRDYPIVSLTADPRVAGYQVPKDLSACPDKRYPNHVFTGAQPISGDQRVRHVWEILPSPWVPFTRYDDDLGPIQGRRRSVKNEGQVASLTANKRTTYEAREGSAIVYTELEETWSIKTDEDGNSLFPIRDRDFYDPSRGPVQERRQLFVPTGEEEGSLENVNGVITQTSYEPYNEFLSVKIVQTYKVDGPQLIGRATNNEGQLTTVTTQRKAADGYIPPSPTATRTVEVSREDAESLVERIIDTPEVFDEKQVSIRKPENIPTEFRAAVPDITVQSVSAGTEINETIELSEGEVEKSQERISEFKIRTTLTTRDIDSYPSLIGQDYDDVLDVEIPFTRSIVSQGTLGPASDVTPLSDENSLEVAFDVSSAKSKLLDIHYIFPTQERISLPDKLLSARVIYTRTYGTSEGHSYGNNYSKKLGSSAGVTGDLVLEIEQGYQGAVPAEIHIFFVDSANIGSITSKVGAQLWPAIKPKSHTVVISGASVTKQFGESASDQGGSQDTSATASPVTTVVNIPPTIHGQIPIEEEYVDLEAPRSNLDAYEDAWLDHLREVLNRGVSAGLTPEAALYRQDLLQSISFQEDLEALVGTINPTTLNATTPAQFPSGKFIVSSDVSLYRYGLAKVTAIVVDVTDYV